MARRQRTPGFSGGSGAPARTRSEHGVSAVEFALVLPILVMLLFGITTAGLSYTHAIGLSNAVREGARFGATADSSTPATWASSVIDRVRATQFDDASKDTAICVQLWKVGTGSVVSQCDQGNGSVSPALSMPASTAFPSVPSGLSTGNCVVRVIGQRPFTIDLLVGPNWNRLSTRGSVARYERDTC